MDQAMVGTADGRPRRWPGKRRPAQPKESQQMTSAAHGHTGPAQSMATPAQHIARTAKGQCSTRMESAAHCRPSPWPDQVMAGPVDGQYRPWPAQPMASLSHGQLIPWPAEPMACPEYGQPSAGHDQPSRALSLPCS
jgi:hypothetical protein